MDWKQKLRAFLAERKQHHAWVDYTKEKPAVTDATIDAWADTYSRLGIPTEEELTQFRKDLTK